MDKYIRIFGFENSETMFTTETMMKKYWKIVCFPLFVTRPPKNIKMPSIIQIIESINTISRIKTQDLEHINTISKITFRSEFFFKTF
jgi:hypothetical protein